MAVGVFPESAMESNTITFHVLYYFEKVWHFIAHKLGLAVLFAALVSNIEMLTALGILFIIDFVCGFIVAYRLRNVSSAAMRRGVAKGLLYMVFISSVTITESAVTQGEVGFATAVAIGLLLFTECLSIIENLINLGLPVPFAANLMRALATKARILGLNVQVDKISRTSYTNDITSMIRVHIPRIRHDDLRKIMNIYYLNWLEFVRTLDTTIISTRSDLAWERLKASLDEVLMSSYETVLRDGMDKELTKVFFHNWNKEPLREFFQRCKRHTMNSVTILEAIDNISSALVTVLYQTVNKSGIWDRLLRRDGKVPIDICDDDLPGTESGPRPALTDLDTEALPLCPSSDDDTEEEPPTEKRPTTSFHTDPTGKNPVLPDDRP